MIERSSICIPSDFRSLAAFRGLSIALGNRPVLAAGLVCHLFGDLAYAAERSPLGVLSEANALIFAGAVRGPEIPDPLALLAADPGFLLPAEGGWFCPLFAERNKHWNPLAVTKQELGGQMNGMRKSRAHQHGLQELLGLDPVQFQHANGTVMEAAQARRVELLIRNSDACYSRRVRSKQEFTATLIQNAWAVLDKYPEEDVNRMLVTIRKHAHTQHPALPKNTEDLLENFKLYHE
jgi:hypothetical protein